MSRRRRSFEEALAESGSVALDIETEGVAPGDALDPWSGRIRLVTLATACGAVRMIDLSQGPLPSATAEVLGQKTIIAHNARFDLVWIAKHLGIRCRSVFCTLTAARLLSAGTDLSNSLDAVLERYLGIVLPKDHSASDWGGLFLTDAQVAYAEADVIHLHALAAKLGAELATAGLESIAELEMKLLPHLVEMELRGFPVDAEKLAATEENLTRTARESAARVSQAFGISSLNPSSPRQVQSALARHGIKVANTNESTLRAVNDGRLVESILAFRAEEKLAQQAISLRTAIKEDGRIHSHFDPTGTETGRFASREPNLQNIARGPLRECFRARDGTVLLTIDYNQIELRVAAALAGEERMISAYREGADLHAVTARAILDTAEVSRADRQLAKSANFGLLYGQGAQGLVTYARGAFGVDLTVEQALALRTRFFSAYPALAAWHALCWKMASEKVPEVRTRAGRRRLIPSGADRWKRFTILVNTPVQGGCADGLKNAMLALATELPPDARLVSTVHDEVVIEVPVEKSNPVAQMAVTIMEQEMGRLFPEVPVVAEASVSASWGKR